MCSCDNLQGLRPKRQQWQPLKPLNSYGPLIHITINMTVEISVTARTMSFRTTPWCEWSAPTHSWFGCNLSPNMHCNIGKNNSWELRNLHTKDWERKNKVKTFPWSQKKIPDNDLQNQEIWTPQKVQTRTNTCNIQAQSKFISRGMILPPSWNAASLMSWQQ
jgi:hypothetical protein